MAAKKKIRDIIVDAPGTTKPKKAAKSEPSTELQVAKHFTSLVTNVKKTAHTFSLGACTAITGKNRAGKTAVLDAFRLALTGTHPIGSDAADMFGLTVDGGFPFAKLTGFGINASYEFPVGRRTAEHTLSSNLAEQKNLLPLVSVRDLLALGTAKAREALFARFGTAELFAEAVEPPKTLSPEQQKLWNEAMVGDGRLGTNDVVQRLSAAGTWLRSKKKALGTQGTALEAERQLLLDRQVALGPGAPTEDLVRAIQAKLDRHMLFERTNIMRSRADVAKSRLVEFTARATAELTPGTEAYEANRPWTLEEKQQAEQQVMASFNVDAATKRATSADAALVAAEGQLNLYKLVLQLRERLEHGPCLACGGTSPHNVQEMVVLMRSAIETFEKSLEGVRLEVTNAHAALREVTHNSNVAMRRIEEEFQKRLTHRERLQADARMVQGTYEEAQRMLTEAGVDGAPPTESVADLRAQLAALAEARAQADRVTTLAAEQRQLEVSKLDLKTVEKELGERLNQLVAAIRKTAQDAVNAWMPAGFTAALMLDDEDGKAVCRWEVIGSDGRPHPYGAASGAEWSALTVAVACAWSDGQEYRFLLLDDADLAGYSAENLKKTLTMLSEAVAEGRLTQVLVAWSRPEEIPTEGWTVVSL